MTATLRVDETAHLVWSGRCIQDARRPENVGDFVIRLRNLSPNDRIDPRSRLVYVQEMRGARQGDDLGVRDESLDELVGGGERRVAEAALDQRHGA